MHAILSVFYLLAALCIGFWGRNYRFGFWGYFFASFLFSPLIGTLMVIASTPCNGRPR